MIKDSTRLRHLAKDVLGQEYYTPTVTYKNRDYTVFFEWCDDDQVDDAGNALNGSVQFEPIDSSLGLSWHYGYFCHRNGNTIKLGDFDSHPNIEEDLEAAE